MLFTDLMSFELTQTASRYAKLHRGDTSVMSLFERFSTFSEGVVALDPIHAADVIIGAIQVEGKPLGRPSNFVCHYCELEN